jgi:hypothetical protein
MVSTSPNSSPETVSTSTNSSLERGPNSTPLLKWCPPLPTHDAHLSQLIS